MTVRVYATDIPLPVGQRPDLARLIPFVVNTRNEALVAAARLFKAGSVVWRIEEDSSGGLESPQSIVDACQKRGLLPHSFRQE